MRFGGLTAAQQRQRRGGPGRDPRHHRAQRRGQVHLLQLPDRRAPPDRRAASCSTARTSPGCLPHAISRKGIARSYQITNILPGATVLENVRIAAQSRRHALEPAAPPPRASPTSWSEAARVLDAVGLARQGGRAGRQPLPRRAAQSRDRHRARHRAAAPLPRRADRGHERGGDARHRGAGPPDRRRTSRSSSSSTTWRW